jgi:hypothetical protein
MSEVALASLKVGECFKVMYYRGRKPLYCIILGEPLPEAKECYVQNHEGDSYFTAVVLPPKQQLPSMWRKVEQIPQEVFLRWEREYEVFGEVSDRVKKKTSWVSGEDFRLDEVIEWNLKRDGDTVEQAGAMKLPEPETSS